MSPLRERMIEDMTLAGLALGTRQASHSGGAPAGSAFTRRSPDQAQRQRRYAATCFELRQQGAARGTFKIGLYGSLPLRNTHSVVIGICSGKKRIVVPGQKRLPHALSEDQVRQLLGPRPQHDPPDLPRHHVCVRPAHRRSHQVGDPLRRPSPTRCCVSLAKATRSGWCCCPSRFLTKLGTVWRDPSQPALAVPQPVRGRAAEPTRAVAYLRPLRG